LLRASEFAIVFAATRVPYSVASRRLSHLAYDRAALLRLCFERLGFEHLGTGSYDSLAAIDRPI
jgi:hypothetical protein